MQTTIKTSKNLSLKYIWITRSNTKRCRWPYKQGRLNGLEDLKQT